MRGWLSRRSFLLCLGSLLTLGSAFSAGAGGPTARQTGEVPSTLGVRHGPQLPGSVVYPAQEIPLRFNHCRHLAKGLDCTRCHVKIRESTRASDLNFPPGATCDACHDRQHPPAPDQKPRCSACHTRVRAATVTAALEAPAPLLHFSHKLHLRSGARCSDCHGDMTKVRLATTLQLPREKVCLGCHDGVQATRRCAACHPAAASGQLVTRQRDDRRMPQLVPRGTSSWGIEHDLAFVEDHGAVSKASPRLCEACHDDMFCQDCHAGPVRPMRIHSGDYITLHAMDATSRSQDCRACHRVQTFCLACHDRLGFGDRSQGSFGVGSPLRFHPEGWTGSPTVAQGHAHAAQRNIMACASCHDEDSCLACHATAAAALPGLDINPHGPSFASSPRCQALAASNHRVCLKCHVPGDRNNNCDP